MERTTGRKAVSCRPTWISLRAARSWTWTPSSVRPIRRP